MRASITSALMSAAKSGSLGSVLKDADPTLIGTLTFIIWESARDFTKYKRGEIDGEDFANSALSKGVAASLGAYGSVIGQMAIPIPVVGALVGASLGSMIGSVGYEKLENVADHFYRPEVINDLKQSSAQLSMSWNIFVNVYGSWKKYNERYKEISMIIYSKLDELNEDVEEGLIQLRKQIED
jgi:hypothetical protein